MSGEDVRTITSEEWDFLKMLLADERISQSWFLARCKAVRPSEIFVSQGLELMAFLSDIGREYRVEAGNARRRPDDEARPERQTSAVAALPPWYS